MEYYRSAIILVVIMNDFHKIDAKLNVITRNTEVMVNDSTYLNCSTSLQASHIHWLHGKNYVYTAIGIFEQYAERFSVEINETIGACNLVIRSVQPSDAGTYKCLEDEGVGEQRSVELIVLDNDPICKSNMRSDGVIGPNSCGIEPEDIKLSCSIKYHGNSLPALQWKAIGDNQSITDGLIDVTSIINVATFALTMKSTLGLNNSTFICQTTRTSNKHYSCSSDAINILYVFSSEVAVNTTTYDEVSCFANTSQSCSYKWKWLNGDDISTESDNQNLKPKKVGMHRCEVTCSIRNESCSVLSMRATVHSSEAISGQQLMLLFVLLLVPALAAMGVIMYLWRKRIVERRRLDEIRLRREVEEEQRLLDDKKRRLEAIERLRREEEERKRREEEERQRREEEERQKYLDDKKRRLEAIELLRREEEERKRREEEERQKSLVELPEIYRSDPQLIHTINRVREEAHKSTRGLTILDGELFVVCGNSSEVEVYDSMKFTFCKHLKLKELFDPKDIVSCNRNKCLYIFNFKGHGVENEILRVETNGSLIKKWSTGSAYGHGLSVTVVSSVILTVHAEHKLYEYLPDGQKVKEIDISKTVGIWPWHAIQLTNGDFVVSHGGYPTDPHRLCLVNSDGEFKKAFGEICGKNKAQLNHPVYLTVDRNGFVMVADRDNRRVLLLDSDLKLRKENLTTGKEKHELQCPTKIFLDESHGRILVVNNNLPSGGGILIFEFIE